MVGRREPSPGLLRRLDALARGAFPSFSTALLMVLAAGPTGLPGLVAAISLACVFFWSVFRPASMLPPVVFLLGLLLDLLTIAPLGSGILTLLITHGLAFAWRRFLARQSFLSVWLVFCAFAVGAAALGFVATALLGWTLPPAMPAVHQALLTAGIYPVLAFVMTRAHAAMTRAEETA